MPDKKRYVLGTRGSLLALTQSRQIKKLLEDLTGDDFDLSVIKTSGDQNTDVPLWQMEGKDFFTKELDQALLSGSVDLVVHSYKDLGTERPAGIQLAAIAKRSFAHDILLIKKTTAQKMAHGEWKQDFVVGTSSPRRMANLQSGLKPFLPLPDRNYVVRCESLRGNVNTRVGKLQQDQYHGIVLAKAGLERLALSADSRKELVELCQGLTFMVLPLSYFPSAAAQGALGIECARDRSDQGELLYKIQKLQDPTTMDEVVLEREAFKKYGGGCHLPVGIHVRKWQDRFMHFHRGQHMGKAIAKIWMTPLLPPAKKAPVFIGMPAKDNCQENIVWDELTKKIPQAFKLPKNVQYLVATAHASEGLQKQDLTAGLWAAGSKTAMSLAAAGHWVHGTADGLGEEEIKSLSHSEIVKILMGQENPKPFCVLTHAGSHSELGEIVPAYARQFPSTIPEDFKQRFAACRLFYWSSFSQYQNYLEHFPEILGSRDASHCSGPGKTWKQLQDSGIRSLAFANLDEFKYWLRV